MSNRYTKHFSKHEFLCPCGNCKGGAMDPAFIQALEIVRVMFKAPMVPNSGARCPSHNLEVGGTTHSRHLIEVSGTPRLVDAADFSVSSSSDRYRLLSIIMLTRQFGGVGIYPGFVHLDQRPHDRVMWVG